MSSDDQQFAHRWRVFATVACGSFMATIDLSVVNLALPSLRDTFAIDVAQVEWVVLSYLLTITSLLLTMGRLADLIGRARLYNLGFVVFTAGSMLCGAAPSVLSLILFRVIQAVGASMLISSATAVLLDAFPASQRGQIMGLNGTIFSAGAMVGPTLGGVLLTYLGWRAIFLVNVPVGLLGMVLAFRVLPREEPVRGVKFDLAGSILVGLAIVFMLLAINEGQQIGWAPLVYAFSVTAVVLVLAFIAREMTAAEPLLRFGLFKTPGYTNALIAQALGSLGNSSNLFLLPFFLVAIQGRSEAQAGTILIAGSITSFVVQPVGGWMADRFEVRYVASGGLLIVLLGYWLYSGVNAGWSTLDVVWRLVVMSLGYGMFMSPNSAAAYRYVAPRERGLAVGTLGFLRNFGFTIGTAVAGSVWDLRRVANARSLGVDAASNTAQVAGLHDTFLIVAGFIVLALLCSLARPSVRGLPDQQVERELLAAAH
ncbi:MAG TPA: DHA2 family efflux MFS transporter permease subunit [Chloroflexota bacterium]|nr:DHA2 family efflux MFS transporter permease subunit [Chloroflexota bacterium]